MLDIVSVAVGPAFWLPTSETYPPRALRVDEGERRQFGLDSPQLSVVLIPIVFVHFLVSKTKGCSLGEISEYWRKKSGE